ncbi:MAG: D-alanyl-D-alanine carboxypeptidase [Alphaproteobacteria bacterium]|nr:D-alanyl-D-alanine carboxypeptidase [Alphaproteobacteria bacterium]
MLALCGVRSYFYAMRCRLLLILPMVCVGLVLPARAKEPVTPAYIVTDGFSGAILDSQRAGELRHPASLTKLMTLYLAFQSVAESRARWETVLKTSARAASQGGSVLELKTGETLTLEEAVMAIITRSANDAAVALAEYLGGSEAGFATRMNETARRIGLTATHFENATGLSAPGQVTTAADMARLALALRHQFPEEYARFSRKSMIWKKRELPNLNGFLGAFAGAEGLKTGFTCPAGYNLVASATRNGKSLIGVVLGAHSKDERESLMVRNLNRALKGQVQNTAAKTEIFSANSIPDLSGSVCAGGVVPGDSASLVVPLPTGYAVELAFGSHLAKVRQDLLTVMSRLGLSGRTYVLRVPLGGDVRYRGLVTGLAEERAIKTCLDFREKGGDCLVLNPLMLQGALEEQNRLARFVAR